MGGQQRVNCEARVAGMCIITLPLLRVACLLTTDFPGGSGFAPPSSCSAVPTIATAWQGVAEAESRRASDAAVAAYTQVGGVQE